MHSRARAWYGRRTSHWPDWPAEVLLDGKRRANARISVVIPARDEESTIAGVVASLRAAVVERVPLVDEVVVIDSDSADGTAAVAAKAGATVYRARDVAPELGAFQLVIRPRIDLMNAAHVAWLRETCLREAVELLVLDTWTALSPTADPLGTSDQAKLAASIVQLAEDINGTVVVVDHSRKNRPEDHVLRLGSHDQRGRHPIDPKERTSPTLGSDEQET